MPSFQNDLESQFCSDVNAALRARDANQLQSILLLEPPFPPAYQQLITSLRNKYPQNDQTSEKKLDSLIRSVVTETEESEDDDGRPIQGWGSMVTFLIGWMSFIRDLDIENLLATYQRLSELQQQGNSALQHPTKGILMLPIIVSYSKVFSRVALGLDKRPELISHLLSATATDEGRRESLPEKAANIVRQAFITCLNDRNTAPRGVTKDEKPDGKKVGIYKMANICLKILFQANNLENCQMIFKNITNSSPPLRIYPASERVTYLYYLGRYHFANTDFFAAQLALQKAYDDCPTDHSCLKNRRLILIYLIAANLILGRFPTPDVYDRPEARGFREVFYPITQAIRKGDLESFRRITNLDLTHESAAWLSHYCIFYQIGHYCEVLVWRSLFRKVFLLSGQQGLTEKSAPTVDLNAVLIAFQYFEKRARYTNPAMAAADQGPGRRQFGFLFQDFSTKDTYIDPDFEGEEGIEPYTHVPDLLEVECICGSLISQGFLNGFISHKSKKFAIQGARKAGSALKAGFPVPWKVVASNNGDSVVGWKKDFGIDTGGVVRLSGARPAGF